MNYGGIMNKVIIGKYVNTHGIKGEIRIKSNFKYKDRVFKKGKEIIIDKSYIINSYRVHKGYDMVTLEDINSINEIINLKGSLVYIDREKYLSPNDFLDEDLVNFSIYCNDKNIGNVSEIIQINENKKLIKCCDKLIPFELVENIDLKNKMVEIKYLKGLI